MKLIVVPTVFLFFCLSCNSGLESDGEVVDAESDYLLTITYRDSLQEDGTLASAGFLGVETEWNLDAGIVVLGPEEVGEPLARLELHLVLNPSEPNSAVISRSILSTSNVRSGVAGEIDARLYTGGAPDGAVPEPDGDLGETCDIRFISSAHVTTDGPCLFEMERVIVNQNDVPETITVSTGFTATDAE